MARRREAKDNEAGSWPSLLGPALVRNDLRPFKFCLFAAFTKNILSKPIIEVFSDDIVIAPPIIGLSFRKYAACDNF